MRGLDHHRSGTRRCGCPTSDGSGTVGRRALGVRNAIRVSCAMETDVPDIYAAGDCVETWHRLLNQPTYLPLGTTAHKQGRIAGENAVGGHQEFCRHTWDPGGQSV